MEYIEFGLEMVQVGILVWIAWACHTQPSVKETLVPAVPAEDPQVCKKISLRFDDRTIEVHLNANCPKYNGDTPEAANALDRTTEAISIHSGGHAF